MVDWPSSRVSVLAVRLSLKHSTLVHETHTQVQQKETERPPHFVSTVEPEALAIVTLLVLISGASLLLSLSEALQSRMP